MNSREKILSDIKKSGLGPTPYPGISAPSAISNDVVAQFLESIVAVGGEGLRLRSRDEAPTAINTLLGDTGFQNIVSYDTRSELAAKAGMPDLSSAKIVILNGLIAVAENGAVWIDDEHAKDRVAPFITEHLIVIIDRSQIVPTMHEAYDRLRGRNYKFGCFISGPSKTADIEQSLVLGAHASKRMTVYVVD